MTVVPIKIFKNAQKCSNILGFFQNYRICRVIVERYIYFLIKGNENEKEKTNKTFCTG